MPEWFDGYVTANGIRIHYTETGRGSGKPVLVLCHGYGDNGLTFTRVAREFERERDVILPDARGHGLSEAPPAGYDPATMVKDLAAFCAALGLDKPVIGGHSMGGETATGIGAAHPDLPRALILIDPGWVEGDEPEGGIVDRTRARRLMPLDELRKIAAQRHPKWSDLDRETWVLARPEMSEAALSAAVQIRHDWRPEVQAIRCPVLLLTAVPDAPVSTAASAPLEGIVSPAMAAAAVALNPRIQVAQIQGSGHVIHYDQYDAFVAAVRAFLATV